MLPSPQPVRASTSRDSGTKHFLRVGLLDSDGEALRLGEKQDELATSAQILGILRGGSSRQLLYVKRKEMEKTSGKSLFVDRKATKTYHRASSYPQGLLKRFLAADSGSYPRYDCQLADLLLKRDLFN